MSMEDAINNLAAAINNLAATRQPQAAETITKGATPTADPAKAAQKAVMAAVEKDRELDKATDKVIADAKKDALADAIADIRRVSAENDARSAGPLDYKKDALPVLTLLVKKDAPAMRKILDSYGVQKASELAPDDLAAVVAQVNELLLAA